MQVLITCVLILGYFSPCLCRRGNQVGTQNNTFNVMEYGAHGDGVSDDSNAFLSAWKSTCAAKEEATLVIPPEKIFLVSNLTFSGACNATSIHIKLQGKIAAPSKEALKKKEALKDDSYWIKIKHVNGLTIDGTGGGRIDGDGSTWWSCESCPRRRILSFFSCNDLSVSNLMINNSPKEHITLTGCNNAKFSNIDIHSPSNSPNTDGFDISTSKNISIEDSTIHSGDDCIAIKEGSSFINVTRVACGPGHGISIGSLGIHNSYQTVEEVYVHNCSFTNTTNGARIKTFPGGSGYARKITFEQIQVTNVKNAIIINQHYKLKGATKHYGVQVKTESSVNVSDVTYRGFNGTYAGDLAINLNCTNCFNIVFNEVYILSSIEKKRGE